MPFALARGSQISYELSGRGPTPLVLIHELGGSQESWSEVVRLLDADFRMLRYDLKGAGRSARASEPFTMEDQAADLDALVVETELATPFFIAGAAGGSAIAVTYAARWPAKVAGLILCPPALSVSADRRRYLTERSELAAREGMEAIVDQTLEKSFPASVIRDQAGYQAFRSRFLSTDPVSYGLANRALAESTADTLASSVGCPCLLLAGTRDSLRPPGHVREVAASFRQASVEELDSAHIMSQQAPVELARHITRFRDATVARISPPCRPA